VSKACAALPTACSRQQFVTSPELGDAAEVDRQLGASASGACDRAPARSRFEREQGATSAEGAESVSVDHPLLVAMPGELIRF
jgi:hypothetical protein